MTSTTSATGPEPQLVTTREAAKRLCISERKLWQLTNDGMLPVVRIGRAVRYSIADLQKLIGKLTNYGSTTASAAN